MTRILVATFALLLALPAAALAEGTGQSLAPVTKTLTVATAKRSTCLVPGAGAGRAVTTYKAPMSGYLTVRLAAARGDWDLLVMQKSRGVGASQGFGAREVVQSWVQAGDVLTVQACRHTGSAKSARVSMTLLDVAPPAAGGAPKLMRVSVGSAERMAQLERMGLDVTHKQNQGSAEVIVAGAQQLQALDKAGFKHSTLVEDLSEQFVQSRRADARAAAAAPGGSTLPSERESYRTYEDYGRELKDLRIHHPDIVKPVVIGHSFQGRELSGVEIAHGVHNNDGRPVYMVVAMHHAREWPSAEAAMEFAYMLTSRAHSDVRIRRLLSTSRVVIVPMINPDGFITTQRAAPVDPASNLSDNGVNPAIPVFGSLTTAEGVSPPGGTLSYRRKNCDGDIPDPNAPCELQWGIDPNRNYGEGWGGPGSSPEPFSQSYHGPGPWSEPETKAVHEFSATHQVTTIITLHNVAALVLRPPGVHDAGNAPDEKRLKQVGDAMANATGYTSQFGFQLYDTSGTTEDWNYAAQGAYGYTIEMGPHDGEFHMPYQTGVIDQWTGAYAGNNKGLGEALLIAGEAAANPADHSMILGTAPKGATLRLFKRFKTSTGEFCRKAVGAAPFNVEPQCTDGPHEPMLVDDELETTLELPSGGAFQWHVNPSTRPFVGWHAEIKTDAAALRHQVLTPKKTTTPNPGLPVGATDSDEDQSFRIEQADNIGKADLVLKAAAEDDYDVTLFYKRNGNLEEVASSAQGAGDDEVINLTYPEPGEYVLRVTNYQATGPWTTTIDQFRGQLKVTDTGRREMWTLSCEVNGDVKEIQGVRVDRGQRIDVRNACARGAGKAKGSSK